MSWDSLVGSTFCAKMWCVLWPLADGCDKPGLREITSHRFDFSLWNRKGALPHFSCRNLYLNNENFKDREEKTS